MLPQVSDHRSRRAQADAMMKWRIRADEHVRHCRALRLDLVAAISTCVLDQCASATRTDQAKTLSPFVLKWCTNSDSAIALNVTGSNQHNYFCNATATAML